ncbi:MAG: IPT/TIG domain-containing protein, partial [Candidatus Sericytochromatia bacterium]|nr:IPT/TIG domain-containing protein [Candidatus Tanganyikabacteria bacterium]
MEAHAYPDQLEIAKVDPTAVTVPAGAKVTADLAMTALYAPVITDFNPKTGQAGTTVTITGTNLAQDGLAAASVTFNGVPAPVSAASSVSLTVTVPAGASGPVRVKVDGVEALAATTYSEAVSILSLNAVHPEVARIGDTLYLEGDFNGSATVNFNGGVSAAATTLGSGRAKVVVPAGAKTGPP